MHLDTNVTQCYICLEFTVSDLDHWLSDEDHEDGPRVLQAAIPARSIQPLWLHMLRQEYKYVAQVLAATGSRRRAAKMLGISVRTLYYKLRRYELIGVTAHSLRAPVAELGDEIGSPDSVVAG